MHGPIVYHGRRFRIERRAARDADDGAREYDIIRHPGAAVILPILKDGRVVMIENHRVAIDRELIELPAGTIDPPESPRECAARELTEETGYRADTFEPLMSFFSSPGICDEHMHVFLARGLTPGPTALDAGERIVTRTMPLADALAAIGAGRIVDAKSIAALLYFERFHAGERKA